MNVDTSDSGVVQGSNFSANANEDGPGRVVTSWTGLSNLLLIRHHKYLVYIQSVKMLNSRQAQWTLFFSTLNLMSGKDQLATWESSEVGPIIAAGPQHWNHRTTCLSLTLSASRCLSGDNPHISSTIRVWTLQSSSYADVSGGLTWIGTWGTSLPPAPGASKLATIEVVAAFSPPWQALALFLIFPCCCSGACIF